MTNQCCHHGLRRLPTLWSVAGNVASNRKLLPIQEFSIKIKLNSVIRSRPLSLPTDVTLTKYITKIIET